MANMMFPQAASAFPGMPGAAQSFNALQTPSGQAWQSTANNILTNPAFNMKQQFGFGAGGTLGGIPLDMLNINGVSGNDPTSILAKFDQDNAGILNLGFQMAGPNSMAGQLNEKYGTVLLQNQVKQMQQIQQQQMLAYQRQLQMQQMMFMQQQAQAQAQSVQRTAASGAASGANSLLPLILIMALKGGDLFGSSSSTNNSNNSSNNNNNNTTTPTTAALNNVIEELNLGTQVSETASDTVKLNVISSNVTQLNTYLTNVGLSAIANDSQKTVQQKIDALVAREQLADQLITAFGLTNNSTRLDTKLNLINAQVSQADTDLLVERAGVTNNFGTNRIAALESLLQSANATQLNNYMTSMGLTFAGKTLGQKLADIKTWESQLQTTANNLGVPTNGPNSKVEFQALNTLVKSTFDSIFSALGVQNASTVQGQRTNITNAISKINFLNAQTIPSIATNESIEEKIKHLSEEENDINALLARIDSRNVISIPAGYASLAAYDTDTIATNDRYSLLTAADTELNTRLQAANLNPASYNTIAAKLTALGL